LIEHGKIKRKNDFFEEENNILTVENHR